MPERLGQQVWVGPTFEFGFYGFVGFERVEVCEVFGAGEGNRTLV